MRIATFLRLGILMALIAGCASPPATSAARTPREPVPQDFRFTADFDEAPQLSFAPRTVFPPFLANQGVRGRATVDFLISAQGYVSQAKVDSATQEAFGASALITVGRMVFLPAKKAGRAVPVAARVSFVFDFED